jgi:hypothetical protein
MNFYVHSDIVIIGQNPEMADYTNPRGDVHGLRWYVVAANERGDTREVTVTTGPKGCPRTAAETLAARLQTRWDTLGKLPVGFEAWPAGCPVYGSDAYVEYGQDDDLAWERRCDADEALGLR